jgi:hypothetical protein
MHGTLCDFLSDIVQNSIEADAKRIVVTIAECKDTMVFSVQDDGKGMTGEVLRKAQDPFYTDGVKHKRRKVGLGIPFLIQTVESVGGGFSLSSTPGCGTRLEFSFNLGHIDCPPLGNLPATLMGIFGYPGDQEVVVQRTLQTSAGGDSYQVSKTEMLEVLGNLSQSGSLNLLREYLQSQETALDELRNHA